MHYVFADNIVQMSQATLNFCISKSLHFAKKMQQFIKNPNIHGNAVNQATTAFYNSHKLESQYLV